MQYADKAGIGSITLIEVNGLETLGDVSSYSDQNSSSPIPLCVTKIHLPE